MIEMKVGALLGNPFGGVSLILTEKSPRINKILVMDIDHITADSLSATLNNRKTSRPLTHELMEKAFRALGATVDKVEITEIKEGTFIANLIIVNSVGLKTHLDARPSDGITMALKFFGKILVAEKVLNESGMPIPEET